MRAMQIIEWGKPLEARDYPDPEPQGEEVLLRVEAAGVCHSDVHIWEGHFDLGDGKQISLESRGVHLPFTMGHEIAGEVAALGPHASGVKVGDKVVAYPWIGCGECAVCKKGEELLCLTPCTLGTRRAGGYGTHVIVPHGRYLLPHDGIPQGLAATYTCSGITAFSALKKTREHVAIDDHLVIIGAGGVGGSAVHIASAAVAGKVIVADIDAQKRAHARQMGAVATIDNRARRGQTGDGADRRRRRGSDRFCRLTQDNGVWRQHPAQGRQAGHGWSLRRRQPDLDRVVPVQDDDDRRLLCRHARRSARTPCPRSGREGPADPDRDAVCRPGERCAERLEERGKGAGSGSATPPLGSGEESPRECHERSSQAATKHG
jgi:D-arabinose 1-dehydrogenase-like Zn-dependent alcohol dehydrogenase